MTGRIGKRSIAAVVATAALLLTLVPAAGAVDIIESQEPGGQPESPEAGWQAGTCTTDTPTCSSATPGQFFTQAAGHPNAGFTQIIVKHEGALQVPVGNLKTVLVDLPSGLSVNPQATPQCVLEEGKFPAGGCPPDSQVGESFVWVSLLNVIPTGPLAFPVYNLAPRPGEPARFGFKLDLAGIANLGEVFLNAGVDWEGDYHEYFTIHVPSVPGNVARILKNRLVFDGTTETRAGGGNFLTNPSTCNDPEVEPFKAGYTTYLHADSYEEEAPQNNYDVSAPAPPSPAFLAGSQLVASPLPKGARPEHCESVPFAPSTAVAPGTGQTDSPAGATVAVDVPFAPTAPIYQSNVRVGDVTLPAGMGVNPAAAPHLQACSDPQFGRGSRNAANNCPAGAKIGTVAIETPVLPSGTLTGSVYLAEQKSRDPQSGDQFRVFLEADSAARGLVVRLLANVKANPSNGQLTAVVKEAPQVPFSRVQVKLDGGPGAVLTSPPTCGPNRTSHAMTAWSGTPDSGPADPGFTLSSAPGGGSCAKSMAERPFGPGFSAKPDSAEAAAYTPFRVKIDRPDGQQELKGAEITLPPGGTAKLAGIPYCQEAEITAAAGAAGLAERAHPSCPAASRVGTAKVAAGSGPEPLRLTGTVYLSGPYRGAPLSLAVVTPAVAGPFDLGTVVVRVALRVNPETTQVTAVSDTIPDVYGGAKVDLRSVEVSLDRSEFTLNGTNCSQFVTAGTLRGGGANPASEAAFTSFAASTPFRAGGCAALKFRPKLFLRLFGATRRAKHPRLRAVLQARPGDANIARTVVALPHALFLDQASLNKICTRVQFAADQCPRKSVYGRAVATSPLLSNPLRGRVYLRSSDNPLPDLVVHLQGQVDVDLVGRIDSFRGGIRTTFQRVPDVPVKKFVMYLPGGRHGLLVASRNLCRKPVRAIVRIKGQNGKKLNRRPRLRTPCRVKKKHRKQQAGRAHGGARGGGKAR